MKKRLRELWEKIGAPVVGYGAVLLVVLAVVGFFMLIDVGMMRLLGLEYRSFGSLLLFFGLVFVMDIPADIFFTALPKALISLGWLSEPLARGLKFVCGVLVGMLEFLAADWLIDSVSATPVSIFVVALCSEMIDSWLERHLKKDEKGD